MQQTDNPDIPEKITPTSPNFQTELAAKIAELVPEVVSDGKLDVSKLRDLMNGDVDTATEKYGLFWPGKQKSQAIAQTPTTATLLPMPEESEDWDTTKNIFIEGDNLEVLKVLQNSYRRSVKMIYIDPPYNTGTEFIYPDNFQEGLQSYLEYTGQKNEAGEKTESKAETSGRKHSNWLSMMYPRLQLAKSLLTDDGVIFISIDDHEAPRLRELCDEVFGEDKLIAQFIWEKKRKASNLDKEVRSITEYVLAYRRNQPVPLAAKEDKPEANKPYPFYNTGNKRAQLSFPANYILAGRMADGVYPAGEYLDNKTSVRLLNDVEVKDSRVINDFMLEGEWRYSQAFLDKLIANNEIITLKGDKFKPYWINNDDTRVKFVKTLLNKTNYSVGTNEDGELETSQLMGGGIFSFPKPTSLIAKLVEISTRSDSIVMDFFSGSGTTAHAVMQLNAEDGGSRSHIQVQLPELIDEKTEAYKAGYKTISDISKERIRRAGKKIQQDNAAVISRRSAPLDTGFRVYKLAPSNFVQWNEQSAKDDIQQAVLDFAANKKPDVAPDALLSEIMLQARVPLSARIERRDLENGNWVYVVDGAKLIAYVAEGRVTEAQVSEIADLSPDKLIILDSAFDGNDALKINIANICKEKLGKNVFRTI